MRKKSIDLIVDKIKDLQFYQKETKKDLRKDIKNLGKKQEETSEKLTIYVENHAKHHTKLLIFLAAVVIIVVAFNPTAIPFLFKLIGIF